MRRFLNAVSLLAVYIFITGPPDVGKPFGNDYFSTVNDFDDGLWTYSQHKFWTLVFWVKTPHFGLSNTPSLSSPVLKDTSNILNLIVVTVV